MSCIPSLKKVFGIVALGAAGMATTGCVTMPCDRGCQAEQSARVLIGSNDSGAQAAGIIALEKIHPEIKKGVDAVHKMVRPAEADCEVGAVDVNPDTGRKTIRFDNCVSLSDASPSAPVAVPMAPPSGP